MLLKRSLCPPFCGLCALCSTSALVLPWRAWWQTWGLSRRPCRLHSRAWDEKSVAGYGASLIVDGVIPDPGQLILARAELGVESVWRQRAHSDSYAAVMVWISDSWWYVLSTSSVVRGGEAHHQDPLHLKHGLLPRRCVWLDCGSGLLASELASSWRCLLLGGRMLSTDLHLLPSVTSMVSLDGEVGF
jgi:hypothetical protein